MKETEPFSWSGSPLCGYSAVRGYQPILWPLIAGGKATYCAAPQGNGSADVKFTAKTYGVVIGIYRCTPVLDFAHIGIDRTLFKTDASDFVIPELDSIGMQQTFRCEVAAPVS